jgi:hypothetical protein
MHEHAKGRKAEELAFVNRRFSGYRISTIHERNKLDTTANLYIYDGGTWVKRTYISHKEFAYRLTIIFSSSAAFGTGLGIFLERLFGGW